MSVDASRAVSGDRGPGGAAPLSLSFLATGAFLDRARERIRSQLQSHEVDETAIYAVDLTLEELVGNTIRYGHDGDDERTIHVDVSVTPTAVHLAIKDDAPPFDPTLHRAPAPSRTLDDAPIGGRGIAMVRRVVRAMCYRRESGQNRLEVEVQRELPPS